MKTRLIHVGQAYAWGYASGDGPCIEVTVLQVSPQGVLVAWETLQGTQERLVPAAEIKAPMRAFLAARREKVAS